MEHYFSSDPRTPSDPRRFSVALRGREFVFLTDRGVFSRERMDPGSRLLVETVVVREGDRLLDLGAGYGAIGIPLASFLGGGSAVLVEKNQRAAALARDNIVANRLPNAEVREGDGLAPVSGERFDLVTLNPPIRAGKAVYYPWLSALPAHLTEGGRLWLVVRTAQGADSLKRFLSTLYQVEEPARGGGYRVLCCTALLRV